MGEETWKTVVMQSPRGPSMSDVLVSVHLVLAESLCAAAKNSSSGRRSPRFMCEETGGEGIVTQPMRYFKKMNGSLPGKRSRGRTLQSESFLGISEVS